MEWNEETKEKSIISCVDNLGLIAGRFYNFQKPDRWDGIIIIEICGKTLFEKMISAPTIKELKEKTELMVQSWIDSLISRINP